MTIKVKIVTRILDLNFVDDIGLFLLIVLSLFRILSVQLRFI